MWYDIVLHWFGLARTKHLLSAQRRGQELEYECYEYRGFLEDMCEATPHRNLKESINDILNKAPKDSANFIAICYSSRS